MSPFSSVSFVRFASLLFSVMDDDYTNEEGAGGSGVGRQDEDREDTVTVDDFVPVLLLPVQKVKQLKGLQKVTLTMRTL